MLSIQAVTAVTNHDQFNKGHALDGHLTKGSQPQTKQATPE